MAPARSEPAPGLAHLARAALVVATATGCGHAPLPDPRLTAARFAEAAERGDARAVSGMLSDRAREELGEAEIERLARTEGREVAARSKGIAGGSSRVEVRARIQLEGGERAELALEQGTFRVRAASLVPAAARTPAQALAALARALEQRSWFALERVFGSELRRTSTRELDEIARALSEPETLQIQERGDRAEVRLDGGHAVWLVREAGTWRVLDLD